MRKDLKKIYFKNKLLKKDLINKTKQNEINRKKNKMKQIKKGNKKNRESKQNKRIQNRENVVEDFDLRRYFELATTTKL